MAMPTTSSYTPWHALMVAPRTEKIVARRLKELGFEVCVPTQLQQRQWSDRRKTVEAVLFPHYVFVASDPRRRNEVFQAGHVLKYVSFGGRIATLSPREVELIHQLSSNDTLPSPTPLQYRFTGAGEEVEILSGSLAGLRGRLKGRQGPASVRLELPSLGCFAEVEVRGIHY